MCFFWASVIWAAAAWWAGQRHSARLVVAPSQTVPQVADWPGFSDMPPVFATGMSGGFVEQICIQALRPYLDESQPTAGTHVDMSHVAATPVDMEVKACVELVKVLRADIRRLHRRRCGAF